MPRRLGPRRPPVGAPLSAREREVLGRVAGWETNEEVAAALGLTAETVKTHLRHIYRKLDVPHRRAAVRTWRSQMEGSTRSPVGG